MPMEDRLARLLSSYREAHTRYSLARLELALNHPARPAPPLVDRIGEADEGAVRARWCEIEMQLDAALAFATRLERGRRRKGSTDRALRLFAQSLRELDRAARAIRWTLTVSESHYDL